MRAKLLCSAAAAALVLGVATAGAQTDMRRDAAPRGGQAQQGQTEQMDRSGGASQRNQRSMPDADRAAQGSDRMGTTGQGAPRDLTGPGGSAVGQGTGPGPADRMRDQDDRRGDDQMRTGQPDRQGQRDRGQADRMRDEPRDVDRADRDRDRTRGQADRDQMRDRDRDRADRERVRDRDRDRAGRDAPSRQRDADDRRDRRDRADDRRDRRDRADDRRDRRDRDQADRRDRDGARLSISQQQRTRVRDVIARTNVRAVTNVNFRVAVGAVVPRSVIIHDLPPDIVEIVPQYRGYRYIVVRDDIVIVQPETMRIVTVIPASGSMAERSAPPTRVQFSDDQRRTIVRHAREARVVDDVDDVDFDVEVGAVVPPAFQLLTFPEVLFGAVPTVRPYRYFVVEDEVVLVDPDDNRIIAVIEE